MMPNFKDRKPAFAGGRSFFPVKNLVIIISVVLMLLGWYSTRLVVAIIPEGASGAVTFATAAGDGMIISGLTAQIT